MKLLIMQSPSATSSLLGPNILLSTLFSITLNVCSSLRMRNQVSHPYKTPCKNQSLCILIFKFLQRRGEDRRFLTEEQEALSEFNLILISRRQFLLVQFYLYLFLFVLDICLHLFSLCICHVYRPYSKGKVVPVFN